MNPLTKRVSIPHWYFLWYAILCFWLGIHNAHRLEQHKWLREGLDAILFVGFVAIFVRGWKGKDLIQVTSPREKNS